MIGEDFYSKDYVEELQRYYAREKEDLEHRYIQLEQNHNRVKETLLGQVDSLKRQLDALSRRQNDQI
jgi:hypothetical protein